MKLSAILLSGGKGTRMGASSPKQYLPLMGKPIALYSFECLLYSPLICEIIVVCEPTYESLFCGVQFAKPGHRRQDSLYNGLKKVSKDCDTVLVHDIARPLLNEEDLQNVILTGEKFGAATLATPVKVTIKEANSDHMVVKTLDRSALYNIHTPQVIKKEILLKGFAVAIEKEITVSDDVSLAELISHPVKLVMGSYDNIKITTPEDLTFAENILRERSSALQI